MGEIGALLGRIINNLPDSLLLESLILGALATVLTAGVWLVLFTVLEYGLIDLDSLSWGPSYIEYE